LASSFIIAHNNPSGNLEASEQDKRLTKQIFEAGKLVELLLMDHLIVGPNLSYSSFKDEGIL
jgi:DNA repair protein RadC